MDVEVRVSSGHHFYIANPLILLGFPHSGEGDFYRSLYKIGFACMIIVVKNVVYKNGIPHYRKSVPADLRAAVGKNEIWKTLNGKTPTQIAVLVNRYNHHYEDHFNRLRSEDHGAMRTQAREWFYRLSEQLDPNDENFELVMQDIIEREHPGFKKVVSPDGSRTEYDVHNHPLAAEKFYVLTHKGEPPIGDITVSEMLENYANSKGQLNNTEKTAINTFTELLGDTPLDKLRKSTVRDWVAQQRGRGLKDSTIQRRINVIRKAWKLATEDETIDRKNPFKGLGLKANPTGEERLPFSKDHLQQIDEYLDKSNRLDEDTKAIFTLIRYTGARNMEIGGLEKQDLILKGPVPHLMIRGNKIRGLKTENSKRSIPLISEALAVAKKLAQERGAGKGPLFKPPNHRTNNLSAKLNKIIRAAGITDKRLTPHSFRHTWEEALVISGANQRMTDRILGHTRQNISSKYGATQPELSTMKATMEEALEQFGEVDISIY